MPGSSLLTKWLVYVNRLNATAPIPSIISASNKSPYWFSVGMPTYSLVLMITQESPCPGNTIISAQSL